MAVNNTESRLPEGFSPWDLGEIDYIIFLSKYLFNWDNISGNGNERLIEILIHNFGIVWVKAAKIMKINDVKTIRVSTKKNSLSLRINDEKTKVMVNIFICGCGRIVGNEKFKDYIENGLDLSILTFGHVNCGLIFNSARFNNIWSGNY